MPEKVNADVVPREVYSRDRVEVSDVIDVDDDIDVITLSLDRAGFTQATRNKEVCNLLVDCSYDGGKTWEGWGGIGTQGGTVIGRLGNLLPYTSYEVELRKGTNRKLRISCEARETIQIKVDIDQLFKKERTKEITRS